MPRHLTTSQYAREAHIIQYLTRYGPVTYEELLKAIPGGLGGRADRVFRRLVHEGRISESYITDYDAPSA